MIIEQDGLAFRVGDRIAMSERPVRQVVGHGLIIRALWTGFALLWLTLTLGLALDMLASGENWGLLMPLVFAAVGVALLLFCIRAAFWRRETVIDRDAVLVTERSTAGSRHWSEPLSAFRGVMALDIPVSAEGRAHKIAAIVLDHHQNDRRIVLWSMLISGGRRDACRDYAEWLGHDVVQSRPATEVVDAAVNRS